MRKEEYVSSEVQERQCVGTDRNQPCQMLLAGQGEDWELTTGCSSIKVETLIMAMGWGWELNSDWNGYKEELQERKGKERI